MNKELLELAELIALRAKEEKDFEASMAKLDARIASLVGKVHSKTATEPGPVKVDEYTRAKPRKERSDKGKPRTATTPEPTEPPGASGEDPDHPIGEVVGQLKE